MSRRFEELAWASTEIGEVSLRRRDDPVLGREVFEVKLGEDYLMSSAFPVAEEELARLALARLQGSALSVAVGGLGLGFTAAAALADERVAELVVVDVLQPVIDWHQAGLVPLGHRVCRDPRSRLVCGDFFAMSAGEGFDPETPGRVFDAVLLDVDHSPEHLLDERSHTFYGPQGTASLTRLVRPGGVYALWSNDPPDEAYLEVLRGCFDDVRAEVVWFDNPLQERQSSNTVYLATRRP